MDKPNDDITIINNTKDSLYYDIDGYHSIKDSIRNMAYEQVTDMRTNKTIDSIPGYTFNPQDIDHPLIMNKSWKKFAAEKGGLTILFYKKNIEKMPSKSPLTTKDVFKRIDLTTRQLDVLKYKIVIN